MSNELLNNLDKIHTTDLGVLRIKKNLCLDVPDVARWCKYQISTSKDTVRKGKNWYVRSDNCVITVNASSYTIITAHRERKNGNAD